MAQKDCVNGEFSSVSYNHTPEVFTRNVKYQ